MKGKLFGIDANTLVVTADVAPEGLGYRWRYQVFDAGLLVRSDSGWIGCEPGCEDLAWLNAVNEALLFIRANRPRKGDAIRIAGQWPERKAA